MRIVRTNPYMLPAGAALIFLPWFVLLGWMAEVSWFLLDDAFFSFRYVRNLLEGHGLVFNRGERVEGYSNFLWVMELALLWGVFGLRPEHAAPWLSVAFTVGTIAAMLWWVARLPALQHRALVAWLALGLVCSSATFAVWTSAGGLETRQFTFFIVLAVVCLSLYRESRHALLAVSLSLAAAALTRPEGPLFAVCCFAWYAVQRRVDTGQWGRGWREAACLAVPVVVLVAGHYLFRYSYLWGMAAEYVLRQACSSVVRHGVALPVGGGAGDWAVPAAAAGGGVAGERLARAAMPDVCPAAALHRCSCGVHRPGRGRSLRVSSRWTSTGRCWRCPLLWASCILAHGLRSSSGGRRREPGHVR